MRRGFRLLVAAAISLAAGTAEAGPSREEAATLPTSISIAVQR
jgi:hypothetical protein